MRKIVAIVAFILFNLSVLAMDASMFAWRSHLSFGDMTSVVDAGDKVFGMAGGSICSVDKQTEEIQTYSKQDGMNGADVVQIGYDEDNRTLVIAYSDGLIDFYKNGSFIAMADLQRKDLSSSKAANDICIEDGMAYLSMPFGVMVLDIQKRLIKDTYYIGDKGADVNILGAALSTDSIYAISSSELYSIGREDNKMDYANWHSTSKLLSGTYADLAVWGNELFVIINHGLYYRHEGQWKKIDTERSWNQLSLSDNNLFVTSSDAGIFTLTDMFTILTIPSSYAALDVYISGSTYWLGTSSGIVRQTESETQLFKVDGPIVNIPYRLKIANQRLYVVPGQRWGDENPKRDADIMIYDIKNDTWRNIPSYQVSTQTDNAYIFDLMNVAVDPFDPEHFFVTSFGTGLLECRGTDIIKHYTINNSPLKSAAPASARAFNYVRTDGAVFDKEGNLWVLNTEVEHLIHVIALDQNRTIHTQDTTMWQKLSIRNNGNVMIIPTPQEMLIDNRNSHLKWIPSARKTPGLILFDDNGTPFNPKDDYSILRDNFQDQDGNVIHPEVVYAMAQDKDGALWLAFEKGVITIPAEVDFKTSNACKRIKIPRNDGTNLADYLLETEQINAIAIDGANRKWFGTATSGLYLISADGQETIEHFTSDNSPLLSNDILSLAIEPVTGKVFIGTGRGLMSYQSDAAYPFEDYSSAYAYPNPVRPDYNGPITITGLMDESVVHIVDNAGNLVCETRSNGGLAIWDGKTADGKRAASGVYNVFCNESANGQHIVVKILVMH